MSTYHDTLASVRGNHAAILEALEAIVDDKSLSLTLAALCEICENKAEHIRSNWQDARTAYVWDVAARALDKLSARTSI